MPLYFISTTISIHWVPGQLDVELPQSFMAVIENIRKGSVSQLIPERQVDVNLERKSWIKVRYDEV